jgi:hypothetical protein
MKIVSLTINVLAREIIAALLEQRLQDLPLLRAG